MSRPVAAVCPGCQSALFIAIAPAGVAAFQKDRQCQSCRTEYTPPTPVWGGLLMLAFGAAVALAGIAILVGEPKGSKWLPSCLVILGLLTIGGGVRGLAARRQVI